MKCKRNKSSLLLTDTGAHIEIHDVTVAGPEIKKTFNRDCKTVNSTKSTTIMVHIYIYIYVPYIKINKKINKYFFLLIN